MVKETVQDTLAMHRWLMNNNLFNDEIKNNLFLYGSLLHKDVKGIDLKIHCDSKTIEYTIFVDLSLKNSIKKFNFYKKQIIELRGKSGFLNYIKGYWYLRGINKILKEHDSLDFNKTINAFIKDYCGDKWQAIVHIEDFTGYKDEIETTPDNGDDKSINKFPN